MSDLRRIQIGLRLPQALVERIDAERPAGVSRTGFIEQAVEAQLAPQQSAREVLGGAPVASQPQQAVAVSHASSLDARGSVRPAPKAAQKGKRA